MHIERVSIADFRNVAAAQVEAGPAVTLICGENGSGKTSLLEAIYVLGRGRSFRSADPRRLIRSGCGRFRLLASVRGEDGRVRPVGIERDAKGFVARIDGEPARTLAALARLFPVLLLNPDSHRLLEGGPRSRRQFLDWGVFQLEPTFLPVWKRFRVVLRHRNAALRQGMPPGAIRAWDGSFVELGVALDRLRRAYVQRFAPAFAELGAELLPGLAVSLDYRPGWPDGKALGEVLDGALSQDRRFSHTRVGPHRAELRVSIGGALAAGRVSRGEQKLLAAMLVLGHARTLAAEGGRRSMLLIDDLPSELDARAREKLLRALAATPAQHWLTSIEPLPLPMFGATDIRPYEISAGNVSPMLY